MTYTDQKYESNGAPVESLNASAPEDENVGAGFDGCDSVDHGLDTDEMIEVFPEKQNAECGDRADDECSAYGDCRLCDDGFPVDCLSDDDFSDDGCSCGNGCCFCRYLKGIRSNIPYILFGVIVGYILSKIFRRRRN